MTLEEQIALFVQKIATKNNLPDGFSRAIKDVISKTISIEEWNSFTQYITNNTSDIKSVEEFVLVLADYIEGYCTKDYVDEQDASTLQTAKDYTYSQSSIDSKDTNILNSAKGYTYSQSDIDSKDITTLSNAKNYTDNGDSATLNSAKGYTDSKVTTPIGYIEINSYSGTLTDAQYSEVLKNNCILVRNIDNNKTTFIKELETTSDIYFNSLEIYTSVETGYRNIRQSTIIVAKATKALSTASNIIESIYNKTQTDNLIPHLYQHNINMIDEDRINFVAFSIITDSNVAMDYSDIREWLYNNGFVGEHNGIHYYPAVGRCDSDSFEYISDVDFLTQTTTNGFCDSTIVGVRATNEEDNYIYILVNDLHETRTDSVSETYCAYDTVTDTIVTLC